MADVKLSPAEISVLLNALDAMRLACVAAHKRVPNAVITALDKLRKARRYRRQPDKSPGIAR